MEKKELVIGTIIFIFFIILITGTVVDLVKNKTLVAEFSHLDPTSINSISVVATIWGIAVVVYFIWKSVRSEHFIDSFDNKFTVKAVIPGHYIIAMVPVSIGIFLIVAFGLDVWGGYLSCLGIPTVLIFLVLSIRKNR